MIGLVKDHFYTLGLAEFPLYLLDGKKPVVFEGGVTCAGKIYKEAIRSVLDGRKPEILFATHVHWDHCGAVSYLKNAFPSMKIAASPRAAEILKREGAINLIEKLNGSVKSMVADLHDVDSAQLLNEPFQPFEIDMEIKDGQIIEFDDDLTIEVLATPGHTRDHLSYYIPQKKILVASEASSCLDGAGNFVTEFLVGYDVYLASLKRLADLRVEILCQGHLFVFVGEEEIRAFFKRAISETVRFKDRICEILEVEDGSIDRVVARIKKESWDTNKGPKQPEVPYLLNLGAMVTHLAEKLGPS